MANFKNKFFKGQVETCIELNNDKHDDEILNVIIATIETNYLPINDMTHAQRIEFREILDNAGLPAPRNLWFDYDKQVWIEEN